MAGIGISGIEAVGITGLRENSGRDGGIEEPYWGPSLIPETGFDFDRR